MFTNRYEDVDGLAPTEQVIRTLVDQHNQSVHRLLTCNDAIRSLIKAQESLLAAFGVPFLDQPVSYLSVRECLDAAKLTLSEAGGSPMPPPDTHNQKTLKRTILDAEWTAERPPLNRETENHACEKPSSQQPEENSPDASPAKEADPFDSPDTPRAYVVFFRSFKHPITGEHISFSLNLVGCVGTGKTLKEALHAAEFQAEEMIASCIRRGKPVPLLQTVIAHQPFQYAVFLPPSPDEVRS